MKLPYGFIVSGNGNEHSCLFSARDWAVLTTTSFSYAPNHFRGLMGMDALGQAIGIKKYPVMVSRGREYFVFQLESIISQYDSDRDNLDFDFKLVAVGDVNYPRRSVSCRFMGFNGNATGGPGACTLELRDDNRKPPIAKIDLRRFKEFSAEGGKLLRVRKTERPSAIGPTLKSLLDFTEKLPKDEIVSIKLIGGDT